MALAPEDRDAIVEAISAGFKAAGGSSSGNSSGQTADQGVNFSKSLQGAGEAANTLGTFMYKAGGSVAAFGGVVEKVAPEMLGLTKVITGTGSTMATYLENTQKVFQGLSKTGLAFNGDLGLIRQTAARARMPLDQFGNLMSANTANMIAFGAGADDGAKKFADLSNAMFEEGAIDGMMALGYSLKDTNEFLMDFTTINRRSARFQRMNAGQQAAAAAEFAKQLNMVSKLTGQQADDLKNELMERQNNGATQAKLRLLERQGIEGVQESYNAAQAELEKGPEVLQNLMDDLLQTGVPMSEATASFAATNKEAYALAQQAAEATKAGNVEEAKRLSEQAAAAALEYANSEQGLRLATLSQVSDIGRMQAENLEQVGPLIDAINLHAGKMSESMGRTVGTVEAFEDLTKKMTEQQAEVLALEGDSQQALKATNEAQQFLANTASAMNENLAEQTRTQAIFVSAMKEMAAALDSNRAMEVADAIGAPLGVGTDLYKDTDGTTASENRETVEQDTSTATEQQSQQAAQEAKGLFGRIYDFIFGGEEDPTPRATGGTISPGTTYLAGERGPELITNTPGTVMNKDQTENVFKSDSDKKSEDMKKLVDAMETANDQLSTLIAINTKQTNLTDKQIKAIKGAGNLIKGI